MVISDAERDGQLLEGQVLRVQAVVGDGAVVQGLIADKTVERSVGADITLQIAGNISAAAGTDETAAADGGGKPRRGEPLGGTTELSLVDAVAAIGDEIVVDRPGDADIAAAPHQIAA